jgi:hypothetical protein
VIGSAPARSYCDPCNLQALQVVTEVTALLRIENRGVEPLGTALVRAYWARSLLPS